MKRILVIDGHPDAAPGRLIHALASAYVDGARDAGHEIERITVSTVDFPRLRKSADFWHGRLLRWSPTGSRPSCTPIMGSSCCPCGSAPYRRSPGV